LVLVHIILGVINAVLRSVTSAFLLLISMGATAVLVIALVGLLAFGLTGFVSLYLSRRRTGRSS
jgi:hypothetical protein